MLKETFYVYKYVSFSLHDGRAQVWVARAVRVAKDAIVGSDASGWPP